MSEIISVNESTSLLGLVSTVLVDGAQQFVAKDHLIVANVVDTGGNFNRYFLDNVEEGVDSTTIAVHRLMKQSLHRSIIKELGDKTEFFLVHFFALLKQQAHGESGELLVNGFANFAYIRPGRDNFMVVSAAWRGDGWTMEATWVEYPYEWRHGLHVLSRA